MLANHAPAPDDDTPQGDSDYDTILAALMDTARGRWFLQEYVRRNRSADTATLLTAIRRIEDFLKTRSFEPGEPADAVEDIAPSEPPPVGPAAADIEEIGETAAVVTAIAAAEVQLVTEVALATEIVAISPSRVVVSGGYHAQAGAQTIRMPEIDFVDAEAPDDGVTVAEVMLPANEPTPLPRDPFADIRALSDEEKIALFT